MRFSTPHCLAVVLCLGVSLTHAQVTQITLTDDVILKDVQRLGLNLGGDNYWSGAVYTKLRSQYNFEGCMYRQLSFGPKPQDGNGYMTWYPPSKDWIEIYRGATFTMVSGPSKGETAQITDVVMQDFDQNGKMRKLPYFKFDRRIKPGKTINEGILIERDLTDVGWFPRRDGYWNSPNVQLVTDDIDPTTKGKAALLMKASDQNAHIRLSSHQANHGKLTGQWLVRFHAKVKSGKPVVTVSAQGVNATEVTQQVTGHWAVYEMPFEVTSAGKDDASNTTHMMVKLSVAGGDMLIDNVALYDQNSSNPTAFRDDLIALLNKLKPGSLRYLQMGGSTVRNAILPPMQTFAYQSALFPVDKQGYGTRVTQDPYSLHDFYVLCEYVNADPWYCLPGTLHPQEVTFFMDYLAGDASTEGGKLRHELGHPKPWTDVFTNIHVEFGNEAWNIAPHYRMGGFNGADYWKNLITAGKTSANYKSNVLFHAGSQAASPRRSRGIIAHADNADAVAIAPYILHTLDKKQLQQMQTPENFYKWSLAYPIWRSTDPQGTMVNQYNEVVKNAGKTLSVYEVNHHPTQGDAPLAIRNQLVDSIGGAANLLNTLLLQMKHQKIKTQCIFTAFGNSKISAEKGALHLWGTVLSMRSGHERYRPTFLAANMANQVMAGDMLQTTHAQDQPTFTATGVFQSRQPANTVT
ncbi:MAG: hypothetical protein ACF8OB_08695, partial [Phycisphaeraceae bacterium JB051]